MSITFKDIIEYIKNHPEKENEVVTVRHDDFYYEVVMMEASEFDTELEPGQLFFETL